MHPPRTPAASLPGILLFEIIVSAQIGRSLSGPVPSDSPTPSPENPADLLLPPALQIIGRLGLDAARRQDATAGFTTEPSLSSSTFPSSTPTVSATPSPSPTDTVGEVRHVSSPVAMIAGSLAGFIVILAAVLVAVVARRHKHNELRTRGGRGAGAGRRPSRRGTRRSARGGYRGDGDDPRTPQQLLSAAPLQRKKTKTYSNAPYELGEDPPDVDGDGLGDGEDAYDIELHERASKHHHPPASYPHPRSRPLGDGKDSSSSSFPCPGDSRPSPEILSPPSEPLPLPLPLPLQRALPPPLHPSGVGVANALLLDDPEDLPPAYPGVR